jgi:hypothetical protein
VNNFIVNGWKVARQIPKWIHGYDAWINFMDEQFSHNNNEEYNSKEDVNSLTAKSVLAGEKLIATYSNST